MKKINIELYQELKEIAEDAVSYHLNTLLKMVKFKVNYKNENGSEYCTSVRVKE